MLSSLLALSFALVSQNVGEDCSSTPDLQVCSGSDILFCNPDTNQVAAFACGDQASGATCSTDTCVGTCTNVIGCEQARNGTCIGAGPLLDSDTTNDDLFMAVPCGRGDACSVNFATGAETCTASPIGACSQSGAQCVGDDLVICVGFADSTDFTVSPVVLRCGTDGATCGEGADGPQCLAATAPECGGDPEAQRCLDGSIVACNAGAVVSTEDCLARGQACVISGGFPTCVTADPACGPLGVGVCSGNTATICAGGSVTSTLDCSTVGRSCGVIDNNGSIGCAAGTGEGEGEPECESDSDCDDDEECDDGECERINTRGSGSGDTLQPAPLFSCTSSSPAALGTMGAALLGVVALRRRRR